MWHNQFNSAATSDHALSLITLRPSFAINTPAKPLNDTAKTVKFNAQIGGLSLSAIIKPYGSHVILSVAVTTN